MFFSRFIQPMPTFWKSGSKGKKKRLTFLEILRKHGNYLCKMLIHCINKRLIISLIKTVTYNIKLIYWKQIIFIHMHLHCISIFVVFHNEYLFLWKVWKKIIRFLCVRFFFVLYWYFRTSFPSSLYLKFCHFHLFFPISSFHIFIWLKLCHFYLFFSLFLTIKMFKILSYYILPLEYSKFCHILCIFL